MRMTQGSAPISDQAPENFDSLPAIFSVIGQKLVWSMGAPPVTSCKLASERQERPGPFAPRPFPLWADCPEKFWPLPWNLPLPRPVG